MLFPKKIMNIEKRLSRKVDEKSPTCEHTFELQLKDLIPHLAAPLFAQKVKGNAQLRLTPRKKRSKARILATIWLR